MTRIEVWIFDREAQGRYLGVFTSWHNALACMAYEHLQFRWTVRTVIKPCAIQLLLHP